MKKKWLSIIIAVFLCSVFSFSGVVAAGAPFLSIDLDFLDWNYNENGEVATKWRIYTASGGYFFTLADMWVSFNNDYISTDMATLNAPDEDPSVFKNNFLKEAIPYVSGFSTEITLNPTMFINNSGFAVEFETVCTRIPDTGLLASYSISSKDSVAGPVADRHDNEPVNAAFPNLLSETVTDNVHRVEIHSALMDLAAGTAVSAAIHNGMVLDEASVTLREARPVIGGKTLSVAEDGENVMPGFTVADEVFTFTLPDYGKNYVLEYTCVTPPPEPTPSPSPSVEPSQSPSPSPSVEPSQSPSPSPSVEPSPSPGPSPSVEPSQSPSPSPSVEPSQSPSPSPSVEPSQSPGPSPSVEQSASPKSSPSSESSPPAAASYTPPNDISQSLSSTPTSYPAPIPVSQLSASIPLSPQPNISLNNTAVAATYNSATNSVFLSSAAQPSVTEGHAEYNFSHIPNNAAVKIPSGNFKPFAENETAVTFIYPQGKVTLSAQAAKDIHKLAGRNTITILTDSQYVYFTAKGKSLVVLKWER